MSLSLQPTLRFTRHFVEMVVAMFLGMVVLGGPALLALDVVGSGWDQLEADAPAVLFLGMAVTMTVPMVAWMRHRGHSWRLGAEMSGAMFVPALAVIACYWLGGVTAEPMCGIACAAMLPAMVVAMLFRVEHYASLSAATAG